MDLNKKDAMIGVGAVVVAALLVVFMRGRSASAGATSQGGTSDIVGGFSTAGTVYVPTTSYDIQYNDVKGNLTYTTTNSRTTTSYGGSPVVFHPGPIPAPPSITTGGGKTVNPPTKQTGSTPKAPSPKAPTTPAKPKMMGSMHYQAPTSGWNGSSVTDYIKQHGGYADMASRQKLANEMGISHYTGTDSQNVQMLSKLKAVYGA